MTVITVLERGAGREYVDGVSAFSWTVRPDAEETAGAPPEPDISVDVPVLPVEPQKAPTFFGHGAVQREPEPPPGKKPDAPAAHPNARRIRDCYAALERRDLETAFKDFSDGFKLEVPPQLPFDAGEVRGPMVVVGLFRKMLELTGGQFKNELIAVTATDDMALSLNRVTVTRRGMTRVYHTSWTYRITGDKIVEGWLHVSLSPSDLREVFS